MPKFVLNIPNILTISRLVMIPLSTILILPKFGMSQLFLWIAFSSFVLAAITDYLDGYFARLLNQISDWGAYMDPLIDKYLIWALYTCLLFLPELNIPIWTVVVIFLRDFIVTYLRNYAIKHNISFKTSKLAKWKTASQMFGGGGILLLLALTKYWNSIMPIPRSNFWAYWDSNTYLFYLPKNIAIFVAVLTVLSGIDYFRSFQIERKKTL